ncbi:MAG: DUF4238 domain-containing protein [Bacteroidetes bacterium]|nr:DUF4238 domain-containing protein [Bacteroidota bacterium]
MIELLNSAKLTIIGGICETLCYYKKVSCKAPRPNMNQHYVPYFYLKNFSFNKESIYVFDKLTRKQFTASLKNVASSQDFYNFEAGNIDLETSLSKVESEIAPILQRLINCDIITMKGITYMMNWST